MTASEPPPGTFTSDQFYERLFSIADLLHKTQRARRTRIAKSRPGKNTKPQF